MSQTPGDKGFDKSLGKQSDDQGTTDVGRFEGEDQHGSAPDVGHGKVAKEGAAKAFEAHDTQEGSKSEEGAIYAPEPGAEHVGESVTKRGEDRGARRKEPGRIEDDEEEEEAGRPRAKTTPRFSTGVNPVDTVDDDTEHMPSGDQGG
jgi:hypothetical protein